MHQGDKFPHTSSTKHIASKKPCRHQNAADTCRIRKGSRVSKATNLFRLKRMLKKLPESLHCFRSRNVSWPSFCIMIPWSHNSVQGSYATPNKTLSSCSPETSAGKEITTQWGKPAVRIICQLFILPPWAWVTKVSNLLAFFSTYNPHQGSLSWGVHCNKPAWCLRDLFVSTEHAHLDKSCQPFGRQCPQIEQAPVPCTPYDVAAPHRKTASRLV